MLAPVKDKFLIPADSFEFHEPCHQNNYGSTCQNSWAGARHELWAQRDKKECQSAASHSEGERLLCPPSILQVQPAWHQQDSCQRRHGRHTRHVQVYFPVTGALITQPQSSGVVNPVTCASRDFAARRSPIGGSFQYSFHVCGSGADEGHRIGIDATGNANIRGKTKSVKLSDRTCLFKPS